MTKPPRFGPTGKFPEGKLFPSDEGGLRFGVAADAEGNVHINFGTPVEWMAMPKEQAINLAKALLRKAGAKKITLEF